MASLYSWTAYCNELNDLRTVAYLHYLMGKIEKN